MHSTSLLGVSFDPRVALSGRNRTRGWRREKSYSDRRRKATTNHERGRRNLRRFCM